MTSSWILRVPCCAGSCLELYRTELLTGGAGGKVVADRKSGYAGRYQVKPPVRFLFTAHHPIFAAGAQRGFAKAQSALPIDHIVDSRPEGEAKAASKTRYFMMPGLEPPMAPFVERPPRARRLPA